MLEAPSSSQSRNRKITLVVLGLLAAGTVFLLPHFVSAPWVGDVSDLPAVPEPSSTAVAPSTAAELTRYRQESQGVLAEIVIVRDRLLEQGVETWAEPEFRQALSLLEAGDERYAYGDYAASLSHFKQARDQLKGLETLGQQKLAAATAEAANAIESLNVPVAAASVELATAIAPDDPQVMELAARAGTLEQVVRHIEAGDQALAHARYDVARAEYGKAAALDPGHLRAARSLADARSEVTGNAFRGQMSRGFAALERGEFDNARAAFRGAGKIRPGDPAVANALAQVDNRESAGHVNREIERADELESREAWAEALAIYESLLEQDPSLTQAKVRLIPARVRADLDARLNGYIDDPFSLSSESAYRTAQTALADAKGIPGPGPRLAGQISELDTLLALANTPVNVVLQSDNQTHVVLFRVAELGRFESRSVRLRPGKYVASGTRSGYRDVRVEFTITGREQPAPVVVRCEEPIG